jgi:parvulin-like peptidyl-prolyl isomerase
MGMMARMRHLAPWFIIAVGGLFVLFMVLSDSKVSNLVRQQSNDIGVINGKKITYQEFSSLVEQYRANQVQRTGKDIPETQMDAFRDQVWDNLVSQSLVQDKIKEFGITITDQEIVDVIQGPNPPQFLKQGFIDSTGNFNRAAYDQAIKDPNNKAAMLQAEDNVREQLVQQKLISLLNSSIIVSDEEVKRNFLEQNIRMDADYALVDAVTMPKEEITYDDTDLKEYYNKHQDEFKVDAQRKLKYILFENIASHGDSTGIKRTLEGVVEKLKTDTSSFKTYVEMYSDKPFSIDTLAPSLLPENVAALFNNAENGAIIGPVLTNQGYIVYKLNKKIKSKDTMVRASHILIKSGKDEKAAKEKIEEIYKELMNGADFEKLAKEKSEDGSAANGGDLGWFGKGQMVKEFENASFNGKVGKIQKPIKTRFGYHIIKVTGKSNNKFVFEKIVNAITPSATTLDRIYENAKDFSYLAEKNNFDDEAKLMKYNVKETPLFTEKNKVIPGLGANKALLHFAFDGDLNDVSSAFKVRNGYVVAQIIEIKKAGVKPFEEVKSIVERKVVLEKKMEKAKEISLNIKNKLGEDGDLNKAKEIYPKVRVSTAKNFNAVSSIPGIGREPAFVQAALDAELNKITDPVKANRGYYLLKVTRRTEFDSTMFSIQKKTLRDNILTQKRNRVFTDWLKGLKDQAEIVDNRYKFFR